MDIILFWLVEKLAGVLPNFIRRRIFHVEGNIRIDYSKFQLNMSFFELSLEITNFNPFKITLDRLLLEVWFAQPTLYGAVLKRYVIPSKTKQTITFKSAVIESQKRRIDNFHNGEGQLFIYYTAYFETRVGLVELENHISRNRP